MELAQRKVIDHTIEAPSVNSYAGINPTQIRYGWTPFKNIWLLGPDGMPNPYAQPYEIAGPDGAPVLNEFFRQLPKGQLIPFTTFEVVEQGPSQDQRLPDGRPQLVRQTRSQSALDCIVLVSRVYAEQGFTILASLQGLDQPTAQRIFRVVQPFNYSIKTAAEELRNAGERIDAIGDIIFHFDDEDYVVPCLQSAKEREIAYKLRDEMAGGAEFARTLATEQLNTTEMSMVNRHSGGMGKTGADPHDEYLCVELERELPQVIGQKKQDNSGLETKLDFLVTKELTREKDDEIERLKAENQRLREDVRPTCGYPRVDGEPCAAIVKTAGDRCPKHVGKEAVEPVMELENVS